MILVAGEALVDLTVAPDGRIAAHLGGGPFNVARTLGRLEVPVGFLGRVSTDAFGRQVCTVLAEDGVDLRWVHQTDEPTTLALAELDADGRATYRFYVQGTSVPGLTVAEALSDLPEELEAVVVGTLGLVLEPFAEASEALASRLAGQALVVVDPNVRPAVIHDEPAYRARLVRVIEQADVVKASDDDLAWLFPGAEPEAAAQRLLDVGARLVVVTLGGAGAMAIAPGVRVRVDAPHVTVADSIGAGDSFLGGFLAWWFEQGSPLLDEPDVVRGALEHAVRVAAVTVSRPGADPPRRAELAP